MSDSADIGLGNNNGMTDMQPLPPALRDLSDRAAPRPGTGSSLPDAGALSLADQSGTKAPSAADHAKLRLCINGKIVEAKE